MSLVGKLWRWKLSVGFFLLPSLPNPSYIEISTRGFQTFYLIELLTGEKNIWVYYAGIETETAVPD